MRRTSTDIHRPKAVAKPRFRIRIRLPKTRYLADRCKSRGDACRDDGAADKAVVDVVGPDVSQLVHGRIADSCHANVVGQGGTAIAFSDPSLCPAPTPTPAAPVLPQAGKVIPADSNSPAVLLAAGIVVALLLVGVAMVRNRAS